MGKYKRGCRSVLHCLPFGWLLRFLAALLLTAPVFLQIILVGSPGRRHYRRETSTQEKRDGMCLAGLFLSFWVSVYNVHCFVFLFLKTPLLYSFLGFSNSYFCSFPLDLRGESIFFIVASLLSLHGTYLVTLTKWALRTMTGKGFWIYGKWLKVYLIFVPSVTHKQILLHHRWMEDMGKRNPNAQDITPGGVKIIPILLPACCFLSCVAHKGSPLLLPLIAPVHHSLTLFPQNLPWAAPLKGRKRQLHFPFVSVTPSIPSRHLNASWKASCFKVTFLKQWNHLLELQWAWTMIMSLKLIYCSCRIYVKMSVLCFFRFYCPSFQRVWNWADEMCHCNQALFMRSPLPNHI